MAKKKNRTTASAAPPAPQPKVTTVGEVNYLAWQKAITGNDLPSSSYRQLSEVQKKAWEAGANAAIQATRPNW